MVLPGIALIVHDIKAPLPPGYMIALDEGIFLIPVPAPPAPHILIVTPLLSAGIITVYVTGVDEVGATVEEAADGDEIGVLVDGKQVGKRDVEGAADGDEIGATVEEAADGDEIGATVEGAADGDEIGVLVDGKQVGKRYVEGTDEGDVVGEAAVDVKVSTIAPFPPGD